MRNIRQVTRVNAIYMRVLEGDGTQENSYREEEYVYFDDEDKLFVVNRKDGELKLVEEGE